MKKLAIYVGLVVGFIAGSWAGRDPYERLERAVRGFLKQPTVQSKLQSAAKRASTEQDATRGTATRAIPKASPEGTNGTQKVSSKVSNISETAGI